ncbi:MAG TPA: hypothetical protein P5117_02745 [Spirochaetia bacterium]|nr:hypothetical protein [Spirochaetales bacterium]HRY80343.1 hypothetical protein [Spirochaetia bacterium]HRZ88381.1 hypothetical protein [Spirochaetia bacterium]
MDTSSALSIRPVRSRRDFHDFVNLPRGLYRDDPAWVPPIWLAEPGEYRPSGNPVLARSEHELFLARRGDLAVGRIVAYVDPRFNGYYRSRVGFFGAFECRDDVEAARGLYAAAEAWMADRGMESSRGPIHPSAECWGLVTGGFDRPPVFLSPHNPAYYTALAEASGYEGVKDLLSYEADSGAGYRIPERFSRFAALHAARFPGLSTRRIDLGSLDRDALHILRILNEGVAENWGYVPVEADEMTTVVRKLRPFLDPDAVWFVEDGGVPVACCLGFPDVNVAIRAMRGNLLPLGFLRLLSVRRRVRDYRLWGLAVLPAWQGRGLDVLLYMRLFEALAPKGVRLEANYILEDNLRIRNALEKLGMRPVKTYRVYEKALGR